MAKIIKIPVLWGVALCMSKLVACYHCCQETWCFHLQGRRWMHQMPIGSLVPLYETVHNVTSHVHEISGRGSCLCCKVCMLRETLQAGVVIRLQVGQMGSI
jgi:hypothetical protein